MCSMAKNENPEMPEINRNLSKSKIHPVLTFYRRKLLKSNLFITYLFLNILYSNVDLVLLFLISARL